ncbi:putative alpha-glucan [Phaeomoniella chlamydospora]|uniref:alpha-1,3-glucan synthase n=1 Tax=Phaeomoniella chlamydospora TaxID=158046 RepID=A0A0G2G4H3_PHACM|nr:putative alpha-glucan [Phaeomoniella chlamydospora]
MLPHWSTGFIDGDPSNNEANGTQFEHEWLTNQYRFGGDVKGMRKHLDYIQGMGIKGIYLTGSPFINRPWSGDGYGPLDFTLLDHHHGVIQDWRDLVDEIHSRNMYVLLDNTLGTMGDLLSFENYVNSSAPFTWNEYDVLWKSDRRYHDFSIKNDVNSSCEFPRMWEETGHPVGQDILSKQQAGCKESDFDAFGDMKGVGAYPAWRSQLSKFASVQDRLRAWAGSVVLQKLNHFSCMQIQMLDIDGFRMDKALQTTLDAHAEFSNYQKQCARNLGKDNFMIVGEAVGEIPFEALYFGRGKQPGQMFKNTTAAMLANNESDASGYMRETGLTALDAAAFHYPTYGALTRFLGLDGPIGFEGVDFVEHWETLLKRDDMVNGITGEFDPRHMFGTTNQDVFRWPSLSNGTQRQMLGALVISLVMPGIPMLFWGEEQQFNVLENLASDYVFGRAPMGSSSAWQLHGCYKLGEEVYYDMPFDSAKTACEDDSISLNHLDPAHPLRNIYKRMFELRQQYPTLNDGFYLQSLSTMIEDIWLPGSGEIPSPTGLWSIYRGRQNGIQDFTEAQANQGVWIVYSNANSTTDYEFDCQSTNNTQALISAFPQGTTVKNLFYPYEEIVLESSKFSLGIEDSTELNGCLSNMTMRPWDFKAFVPVSNFSTPAPSITKFVPGHDARIVSSVSPGRAEDVPFELHFSRAMDCDKVISSIEIRSTTENGKVAEVDKSSLTCNSTSDSYETGTTFVAQVGTEWILSGQFTNVYNGIHSITVANATSQNDTSTTNARDTFMFRIGQEDNPMVFVSKANYTTDLLQKDNDSGKLSVSHKAPGADLWRYSLNWGSSWSNWTSYTGGVSTLEDQPWSGTKAQRWTGDHVILQYWSEKAGSSDHIQHGDAQDSHPRRWPHVHVEGIWNQYGYDAGLSDKMHLTNSGWTFELTSEWPTEFVFNVWGMNPDGVPDKTKIFGDIDSDKVLDIVPPDSLADNVIKISEPPGMPHTAYQLHVDDGNWRYSVTPSGSAARQIALFVLLACLPFICACAAIFCFWRSFYQVKHNKIGVTNDTGFFATIMAARSTFDKSRPLGMLSRKNSIASMRPTDTGLTAAIGSTQRRTVLIATMEYEIEDWNIRIKIGGLGVMANLMGKNLGHQNLIWVIPCVGGIEYPTDQPGEPMHVTVLGTTYSVSVQYHVVRNITYVLLDAPVFRQQTKAEPYPARMDDLESAIYYSAWNACIAETIKRFPTIDLYHINDYHGAIAPLYLLPQVIPCCLSLHNAEFQGLWPIRNPTELDEISRVFNLDKQIIQDYVQFGEIFNLLHAGASYLRVHQRGFGAVGVSKKYGKRSLARYPIFWGLSRIGALPNPDPSDTAEWKKEEFSSHKKIGLDFAAEAKRGDFRVQAQKWAGLKVDPNAELFVFVGRWSMQKGVDAIADVFPSLLEKHDNVQLICIGPVIDLYGKFAALKLAKLMEKYPERVYSKPEFTQLPPYIFSGAEFALIPSRDEPFGLVAVEFGRKGALGVGARVGGLGQMPGFWFTIESTSSKHLLSQFKSAIKTALNTDQITRAEMRARSSVQRFPVAQWVEDLEKLQNTAINKYLKVAGKKEFLSSYPETPHFDINNPAIQQSLARWGNNAFHARSSRMNSPARLTESEPSPDFHPRASVNFSRQRSVMMGGESVPEEVQEQDTGAVRHVRVALPHAASTLSLKEVLENSGDTIQNHEKQSFKLQSVDPSFTDSTGFYYKKFEKLLGSLNSSNSETKFCIEEFLNKSEKDWFCRFHLAKLGSTGKSSKSRPETPDSGIMGETDSSSTSSSSNPEDIEKRNLHALLGENYVPPTGLRNLLHRKIGDWPIYAFLLSLGQIVAVTSYQITLITGKNGQSAVDLYIIASIYLASTLLWWTLFRYIKSIWVLSTPFLFYGMAFFLLGLSPFCKTSAGTGWVQNVATGLYALASASGSLYFALNFGSEGMLHTLFDGDHQS